MQSTFKEYSIKWFEKITTKFLYCTNLVYSMKYIFLITFILNLQESLAQNSIPLIHATSTKVSIRDGEYVKENYWTLTPEARPDIYIIDRTREEQKIVFYTDIDSISTNIKSGETFDFIILLQGKDSCFTQIKSAVLPNEFITKETHDTIPFELTSYNAIKVKAVLNERDTLNLHLDISTFDFTLTKESLNKKSSLVSRPLKTNKEMNSTDFLDVKNVKTIQIGSLVFDNPILRVTDLTAHEMDGRFGWNLFDGKIVEIDYEKNYIIIHSSLPKISNQYKQAKIHFKQSFVCIEAQINIQGKQYKGDFIFDNGADQAVVLDSIWLSKHHVPNLPFIKTIKFSDPRGVVYNSKVVQMPSIQINGFVLQNVPTTLMERGNPVQFEVNFLGNDVLKRFNTILDFKEDRIYFKPNNLIKLPYRDAS